MNQAGVSLLLQSEGAETDSSSFFFSQSKSSFDHHLGTEDWKGQRDSERVWELQSSSDSDLTCSHSELAKLSTDTSLISSLSVNFEDKVLFNTSLSCT